MNWKDIEKQEFLDKLSIDSDEEIKGTQRGDIDNEESIKMILLNRKNYVELLNSRVKPHAINVLSWTFNIILILFVTLCIVLYAYSGYNLKKITNIITDITTSYSRYDCIVKSGSHIEFLLLANKKAKP